MSAAQTNTTSASGSGAHRPGRAAAADDRDTRQHAQRACEALTRYGDNLARHIYLRALQDTNEVLFYKLVTDHVEEMLPIVYTPTIGLACQQFSHIYRRPRGLFLSYPHRDRLAEILHHHLGPDQSQGTSRRPGDRIGEYADQEDKRD